MIVAALLILPFAALIAADYQWTPNSPGALLYPLGAVAVMLGSHELSVMLGNGGYKHSYTAAMLGAGLIWIAAAVVIYWPLSPDFFLSAELHGCSFEPARRTSA